MKTLVAPSGSEEAPAAEVLTATASSSIFLCPPPPYALCHIYGPLSPLHC